MFSFLKKNWKFLFVILILICIFTISFIFVNNLKEKTVYIIKIEEPISYEELDIDKLYNFLKNFRGDGLLLFIDSPGGGLETYKIVEVLKNISVPKVCYIHYYGASGAYWICSQADYIISEPFAITGSVGGIMMFLQFPDLLEKLGIKPIIIKEGKYKDIGNPFRNLTEEEKEILHQKLKLFVDKFREDVLRNRNITNISKVFSGEWFFGIEAKKLGLVDQLGDFDLAKQKIAKMLNTSISRIRFIYLNFKRKKSILEELFGFFIKNLFIKFLI